MTFWGLAAHRTPPGSFALCDSNNVLSVRKRSDSGNVLSARKRSVSGKALRRNGNQLLALPEHSLLFSYSFAKL
ncbi:hypothetical protein [Lysinibacillus xylanilyticus]|uniref:hypothetical protein n=1 Tax=Lysinibacillus xylanilyticus TaxID=582475 RepID=UPI003D05A7B4